MKKRRRMNKILTFYKKFQKIIDYIFFGGLTTLVNIGVFFFIESVLNKSYVIANIISIIAAILFAYVTNKIFVFKSKTHTWKDTILEFLNFISFRFVSGLFDMASMYILIDILKMQTNPSKILTQFIVLLSNYLFSKYFVFRHKK